MDEKAMEVDDVDDKTVRWALGAVVIRRHAASVVAASSGGH